MKMVTEKRKKTQIKKVDTTSSIYFSFVSLFSYVFIFIRKYELKLFKKIVFAFFL